MTYDLIYPPQGIIDEAHYVRSGEGRNKMRCCFTPSRTSYSWHDMFGCLEVESVRSGCEASRQSGNTRQLSSDYRSPCLALVTAVVDRVNIPKSRVLHSHRKTTDVFITGGVTMYPSLPPLLCGVPGGGHQRYISCKDERSHQRLNINSYTNNATYRVRQTRHGWLQ